jgi:inorganic triphosphatase YgiF
MQIELRFRILPEFISALRRYPMLRQIASSTSRVVKYSSTYFDTVDFALRERGLALHVKRVGKQYLQILEGLDGDETASFSRDWEIEIPSAKPDLQVLSTWLAHEARFRRQRFKQSQLSDIVPLFTHDVSRALWELEFDDGCVAELTLDHGDVKCGVAQQFVSELLLTHQAGPHAAFYDFAFALQRDLQLRPICRSSVRCGYALRDLSASPIVTAKQLVLHDDIDAAQGLQIITANCLLHIQGNAAGVVYSEDAESVHQMRVGLRRLRSALEIFESLIPCPVEIKSELAWLAAELGDARDWEVLDAITLPALAACWPNVIGMTTLQTHVRQEVIRKHRDAALAVDSVRSARLWLLLHRWLITLHGPHDESQEDAIALSTPLRKFAAQHIKHFHKKTLRRCESMQIALPESRHRVRIASKRLRYATEFFASYYRGKSVTRFIDKLSKLQDVLGASNDKAVAGRLLVSVGNAHPDMAEICAFIRGYQTALDDSRLTELGKRIRRFSATKKLRLRDAR